MMSASKMESGSSKMLSKSNYEFSSQLYKELLTSNKGTNVFFSPLSISAAMSLTHLGARGTTKSQIETVLKLQELGDSIHSAFEEYLPKVLAQDTNATIKIGNKLFPNIKYEIASEYLALAKKHYNVSIEGLNFGESEEAREVINTWVSGQTDKRIPELIPDGILNDLTFLVIVNAIYFKGQWAKQFKEESTKKETFHGLTGKKTMADMMHMTDKFPYMENREMKFSAIELPYKGDTTSMIIILPGEADGLKSIENNLSVSMLQNIRENLYSVKVDLKMPKFKMELGFDLCDLFKGMGMTDLFDASKADLSGMDPSKMTYVSNIIHKACVEVNEEGTVAVAATAVVSKLRSLPRPPMNFHADHPFIFYIYDKKSDIILFMGRFLDVPDATKSKDEL